MTAVDRRHPQTLALHGGSWRADPATGAVAVPIYQSTSFQFRDTEHARRLFGLEELGYTYTRTVNPGREVLERRLTALEGGKAALAVATGAAALLYSVLNLARAGDNVVVPAAFAAWEGRGLVQTLLRLGVDVRVVENDAAEFADATTARTRAYVAAGVSGPDLHLLPVRAVATIGRSLGVPLIVDNSAAPQVLRPLADGAAVAVYSAIGPLGGTADGGIIVDGGTFAWDGDADRLPSLNRPDPSYHGTVWTQVVRQWNASAFIAALRGRFLRDFGAAISPFDVTQLIQAVETLPLRAGQQTRNAAQVAAALAGQGALVRLSGPVGGRLALHLADAEVAAAVLARLTLVCHADTAGGVRSCAWRAAPATVHVAVGLEHPDDVAADLVAALAPG